MHILLARLAWKQTELVAWKPSRFSQVKVTARTSRNVLKSERRPVTASRSNLGLRFKLIPNGSPPYLTVTPRHVQLEKQNTHMQRERQKDRDRNRNTQRQRHRDRDVRVCVNNLQTHNS